jgi:glycoprotein 3-alpha-L-fucosyltransferase
MILLSMESTGRYPQYGDARWLARSNYTDILSVTHIATYPYVHISYLNLEFDQLMMKPWPTHAKIAGVAFFISNCNEHTGTKRLFLMDALERSGVAIYSFGTCRQTHRVDEEFPECALQSRNNPMADYVKICVLRRFRFTAAFENDVAPGYVSEKLLHALIAGSVPIYAGTRDVKHYLPSPHAAIIVESGDDARANAMVTQVKHLLNDDSSYNAKLAWKHLTRKQLPKSLLKYMHNSYGRLACVVCDDILKGSQTKRTAMHD